MLAFTSFNSFHLNKCQVNNSFRYYHLGINFMVISVHNSADKGGRKL